MFRTALAVGAVGLAVLSTPAFAADLAGTWSGGGSVSFSSGTKEAARCRVTYKGGGAAYYATAACATASGKVDQTMRVRRTGANSFAGSFVNPQYNVSGSVSIVVRGNSQTLSLATDAGSGLFRLSRR